MTLGCHCASQCLRTLLPVLEQLFARVLEQLLATGMRWNCRSNVKYPRVLALAIPAPSAFPGNVEMLGCYGSWQYVCTPCMYCSCKMLSNQIWIIVQLHLILRNLTPPPPSYIMFFSYVTKYSKCTKTCPWHANASPDGEGVWLWCKRSPI